MKSINFVFQLHRAYQIKPIEDVDTELFAGEADFRETNRTEYQPFFALLERNIQKFPGVHVSLLVSGVWLEQAEKWDSELIRRLKRLVNKGNVQLIANLYDFSLAEFFDMDEAEVQLALLTKKINQIFGVQPEILAFPGLVYHRDLAKIAAKHRFRGILAANLDEYLDFRGPNQIFEIKEIENLKLININKKFSQALAEAKPLVMREELVKPTTFNEVSDTTEKPAPKHKSTAAEFVQGLAKDIKPSIDKKVELPGTTKKLIYSMLKVRKELELEMLNSNSVTIFLDTHVFASGRDAGIVRFFDELFMEWLKDRRNKFLNLDATLESASTKSEIDFKGTASLWGFTYDGLKIPEIFASSLQQDLSRRIYDMRTDVIRSKEKSLYEDFGRFTAYDYLLDLDTDKAKSIRLILDIFTSRVQDKLPQPAKIAAKAGKDNGQSRQKEEDFSVVVKRVPKKKPQLPEPVLVTSDDDEEEEVDAETLAAEEALVRQMSRKKADMEKNVESLMEAELVQKKKKVGKKLVIE